jgi:hypothetical protein
MVDSERRYPCAALKLRLAAMSEVIFISMYISDFPICFGLGFERLVLLTEPVVSMGI